MKQLFFSLCFIVILFSCRRGGYNQLVAGGDIITTWNSITLSATKKEGLNSNLGSRVDAIEAIAVYDAVNSILDFGTPYHYFSRPAGPASAEAAAAQAAHDVLLHFFPLQQSSLDSALNESLGKITAHHVAEGKAVGAAVASDILALRANDGSSPGILYPDPVQLGVGIYRATPTAFAKGINQQWARVTPFALSSPAQFRAAAPPTVGSPEYIAAFNEVASLGSVSSSTRTAEQANIAQFYKQDAELTVNEIARLLVSEKKLTIDEAALVYALTDIAVADARIAIWDSKYHYLFWRPVTALNADSAGIVTNGYAGWLPLLATPPHPDYPSGHSGTVRAGLDILKSFFGDNHSFTLHTTTSGVGPRTVQSLSTIVTENCLSRIYGGIHFSFDNTAGQELGKKISAYILLLGPKKKSPLRGTAF